MPDKCPDCGGQVVPYEANPAEPESGGGLMCLCCRWSESRAEREEYIRRLEEAVLATAWDGAEFPRCRHCGSIPIDSPPHHESCIVLEIRRRRSEQ